MIKKIFVGIKVRKLLSTSKKIKLELGAGPFRRRGWIGIDFDPKSEIIWDLSKGIPFPDRSVEQIHSEHFFEHLKYPAESGPLFKECYRVLKKGSKISFSVPNIGKIVQAYAKGPKNFWKNNNWWRPESWITTPMDVLNWYGIMGGEHKFMYDEATAKQRLKEVGFIKVRIRQFNSKLDYNYRVSSLYVEGYK